MPEKGSHTRGLQWVPPFMPTPVGLTLGVSPALVLASRLWGNTSDGRCPIFGVAPIPCLRGR